MCLFQIYANFFSTANDFELFYTLWLIVNTIFVPGLRLSGRKNAGVSRMLYFQSIKRQFMEDSAIAKPDTIQWYDGLLGVETLHPPVFHPDLLRGTELGLPPDYFGDLIRKETDATVAIQETQGLHAQCLSHAE